MIWTTRRHPLALTRRAAVMGILNVTPDSFSDGGRHDGAAAAIGQAQAQALKEKLQAKYAGRLGDAALHLERADLGARGVFYRIQSQGLAESDANHICSALKQMNTGCILVRK